MDFGFFCGVVNGEKEHLDLPLRAAILKCFINTSVIVSI